jgi:hypothetical protein
MGRMKQFSVRDLLFLVVIVALALGWWLDRRPVPARFQLQVGAHHAVVLDTATGQVWTDWIGDQSMGSDTSLASPKVTK